MTSTKRDENAWLDRDLTEKGWWNYHALGHQYERESHPTYDFEKCSAPTCTWAKQEMSAPSGPTPTPRGQGESVWPFTDPDFDEPPDDAGTDPHICRVSGEEHVYAVAGDNIEPCVFCGKSRPADDVPDGDRGSDA